MPQITGAHRRGGFTLIEILVALILIALLLGAVVPAVLNQVTKGDTNRVLEDLDAVTSGMQTFRVDTRRWPGDLEDLITAPTPNASSTDADIDGGPYTQSMVNRWDGSYLDGISLDNENALATGAEAKILNAFSAGFTLNDETYISIGLDDLPDSQMDAIDVAVDGATNSSTGRVRISGTTLYYLATPKR